MSRLFLIILKIVWYLGDEVGYISVNVKSNDFETNSLQSFLTAQSKLFNSFSFHIFSAKLDLWSAKDT